MQRDKNLASKGWFNPEDFTAQKVCLGVQVHTGMLPAFAKVLYVQQ